MDIRYKLSEILFKSKTSVLVLFSVWLLSLIYSQVLSVCFGTFLVVLILFVTKFNVAKLGYSTSQIGSTIVSSFFLSLWMYGVVDIAFQPIIEYFCGKINYGTLNRIEGDFSTYILMLVQIWIQVSVIEICYVYGYFIRTVSNVLGDRDKHWRTVILVVAFFNSIIHYQWSLSGAIVAFILHLFMGTILYHNRDKTIIIALMSAFYNTINVTLIYLGVGYSVGDILQNFIDNW